MTEPIENTNCCECGEIDGCNISTRFGWLCPDCVDKHFISFENSVVESNAIIEAINDVVQGKQVSDFMESFSSVYAVVDLQSNLKEAQKEIESLRRMVAQQFAKNCELAASKSDYKGESCEMCEKLQAAAEFYLKERPCFGLGSCMGCCANPMNNKPASRCVHLSDDPEEYCFSGKFMEALGRGKIKTNSEVGMGSKSQT